MNRVIFINIQSFQQALVMYLCRGHSGHSPRRAALNEEQSLYHRDCVAIVTSHCGLKDSVSTSWFFFLVKQHRTGGSYPRVLHSLRTSNTWSRLIPCEPKGNSLFGEFMKPCATFGDVFLFFSILRFPTSYKPYKNAPMARKKLVFTVLCIVDRGLSILNLVEVFPNDVHMLWHLRHMLLTWRLTNWRLSLAAERCLIYHQVAQFTGVALWDDDNSLFVTIWRPPMSLSLGKIRGVWGYIRNVPRDGFRVTVCPFNALGPRWSRRLWPYYIWVSNDGQDASCRGNVTVTVWESGTKRCRQTKWEAAVILRVFCWNCRVACCQAYIKNKAVNFWHKPNYRTLGFMRSCQHELQTSLV